MAWAPDYITSTDLKSFISPGIEDVADDAEIAFAITAASRAIDAHTGRQFGQSDPAVARYYTPVWDRLRGRYVVVVDDLMTTTDLVVKTDEGDDGTFETTLTLDTDFRLAPYNAAADGRPWTLLVASDATTLPTHERAMEATAKWGWDAVPAVVEQACLIQASRLWKRKDAPFGIAGSPDMGSEMRLLAKLDPDVELLLNAVRRRWLIR